MEKSARNDAIAGLMVLAVVGVFAPVTSDIFIDPLDPGFSSQDFPIGVLVLMTVLAFALLGRALILLAKSGWQLYEPGESDTLLRFLLPIVGLGFLYVWLIEQFQYPIPTFFALSASMAVFGNRGLLRLVVVPAVVTIIFYVVFYGVFGLNEAAGEILSYENDGYFRPFRKFLGLSQ